MEQWQSFFVAQAGASAALTGLLFVAVSINLTHILELDRTMNSKLADRAFGALITLLAVLLASSLLLIPTTKTWIPGLGLLVIGAGVLVYQIILQVQRLRTVQKQYRSSAVTFGSVGILAATFILVAAVAILLDGTGGIAWLVVSIILSYLHAIEEAWVLLVEINR